MFFLSPKGNRIIVVSTTGSFHMTIQSLYMYVGKYTVNVLGSHMTAWNRVLFEKLVVAQVV